MAAPHPSDAPPPSGARAGTGPQKPSREDLSELIDGESGPAAAEDACRRWRQDPSMRADWHVYQLIGDVLRSDDMAATPARDAAFLEGLRQRLKDEPVPMAPAPLPVRAPAARRWMTPAAAVAGFVAVGVAVVVLRDSGSSGPTGWSTPIAATAPVGPSLSRTVNAAARPASGLAGPIDAQSIRDARLETYFEAHRGVIGAMPSPLSGAGGLTGVEMQVPQR